MLQFNILKLYLLVYYKLYLKLFKTLLPGGDMLVTAMVDIGKGEEVTFNYKVPPPGTGGR